MSVPTPSTTVADALVSLPFFFSRTACRRQSCFFDSSLVFWCPPLCAHAALVPLARVDFLFFFARLLLESASCPDRMLKKKE